MFALILLFTNGNIVKADNEEIELSYQETVKTLDEQKVTPLMSFLNKSHPLQYVPTQNDVYNYYYNQLDNDISREVYNGMANNTSGEVELDLSKYKISVNNENLEILKNYINDGFSAYDLDLCENYIWSYGYNAAFYADTSSYQAIFGNVTLTAIYDEFEDAWNDRNNFNQKLNQACNSITGSTVYEKVTAINKYICDNSDYAYKEDGITPDNSWIYQLAYSALINKKAVCAGQARLFNLMCRKNGIMSIYVVGSAEGIEHAWNYVYDPSREQWYAMDVTWNNDSPTTITEYTMVGSETVVNGKKFSDAHIPNVTVAHQGASLSAIPVLSTTIYNQNAPGITKTYSTTALTNGNVNVTLQADKTIQSVSNWTLSTDKKTLTRSYSQNVYEEKVTVKALSGDATTIEVTINNIDKNAPEIKKITYTETEPTNQNVTVTIEANEEVQGVTGWSLSTDKKKLTKTYQANAVENVVVKDLAGNSVTANITINNIDKDAPEIKRITYTETELTNQNVTVIIEMNEELQGATGWQLSTDKKKLTKTYQEKGAENVVVKDLAGNSISVDIVVSNIDKDAPICNIETELSNEKDNCNVTITANEEIQPITGWTLLNDKKTLKKKYTENKVKVTDLAGNETTKNIEVNGIERIFKSDVYIIEKNYIKNIQPNLKYEDFIQGIQSNQEYIIKEEDRNIAGTELIKTGQVLIVGTNRYKLVVTGDINGDGQSNQTDLQEINMHRLNQKKLTDEKFEAGDINKDTKLDIKDMLLINRYRIDNTPATQEGAKDIVLSASNSNLKPGDTFTITMTATFENGINGIYGKEENDGIKINYDNNKLELINRGAIDLTDINSGKDTIALIYTASNKIISANIYTWTFKVKQEITEGETEISINDIILEDLSGMKFENVSKVLTAQINKPSSNENNDNNNEEEINNNNNNNNSNNNTIGNTIINGNNNNRINSNTNNSTINNNKQNTTNTNKSSNTTTIQSKTKDSTTANTILPKTGFAITVGIILFALTIYAVVAYRKYKKFEEIN